MRALVEQVDPALASVEQRLPRGFPGRTWEAIRDGMRSQARLFAAGLEAIDSM
jgi:serine/threonine-protein kinase HipA